MALEVVTGPVWNPMAQQYEPKPLSLADFLLARIAEDEELARDSYYETQHWYAEEESVLSYPGADDDDTVWMSDRKRDSYHVVNWQPRRVLAECETKRWLVETFRPIDYVNYNDPEILRRLALPYADHPDYDEAWKP